MPTAAAVNVVPSQAVDPPPPIAAEPLTARSVFPELIDMKLKLKAHDGGTTVVYVDDPSRTVDVRYTVQPGARFPWHTHDGPVIVNIVSGSLTYVEPGTCDETTYSPGQAFVDAGHGHVHSAYNPGTEPTVLIATFFEAPETGALLDPGRSCLLGEPAEPRGRPVGEKSTGSPRGITEHRVAPSPRAADAARPWGVGFVACFRRRCP